jgi:hypothetical protein
LTFDQMEARMRFPIKAFAIVTLAVIGGIAIEQATAEGRRAGARL